MSEKTDKGENKVSLTVITLSGNFTDEFNVHQTLQHVIDKAFHELKIKPAANEQWVLTYNGTQLNATQTIGDAHLPNGAQLQLAPVEGGGGAWTRK